ncbi:MAG: hypothetical protein R3D02_01605 [Hyphomicrobiales bacterium]
MRWLLLLLMLLLPSGLAGPATAADCGTPFYAGDWERDGAKLREFNRLQITFKCRTVPLTGGGEMTEIDYHVRAYNRCAPRDCIWGYSPARVDERGRLVANFSTFYSERVVTIEPGGIGLRVVVFTDFGDPAVEDKKEEFFLTRD